MSITNETKIVEEKFDDCVPAESAQLFDSELHHIILTFERAQETKKDVSRYEDEDTNKKSKEQASL